MCIYLSLVYIVFGDLSLSFKSRKAKERLDHVLPIGPRLQDHRRLRRLFTLVLFRQVQVREQLEPKPEVFARSCDRKKEIAPFRNVTNI